MTDVLEMIFIHQGYDVDLCNSLNEVDRFFFNRQPDLVIIGLPEHELSLTQVSDLIRERTSVKDLPLIFLSPEEADMLSVGEDNPCTIDPLNFYLLSNQVRSMLNVTV